MKIDDNIILSDHIVFKEYEKIDIIKIGSHNTNWELLKSNLIIENMPYMYFKTFYEQLNLDLIVYYHNN